MPAYLFVYTVKLISFSNPVGELVLEELPAGKAEYPEFIHVRCFSAKVGMVSQYVTINNTILISYGSPRNLNIVLCCNVVSALCLGLK